LRQRIAPLRRPTTFCQRLWTCIAVDDGKIGQFL